MDLFLASPSSRKGELKIPSYVYEARGALDRVLSGGLERCDLEFLGKVLGKVNGEKMLNSEGKNPGERLGYSRFNPENMDGPRAGKKNDLVLFNAGGKFAPQKELVRIPKVDLRENPILAAKEAVSKLVDEKQWIDNLLKRLTPALQESYANQQKQHRDPPMDPRPRPQKQAEGVFPIIDCKTGRTSQGHSPPPSLHNR